MDPQTILGKRKHEEPSDPRAFKKRKLDKDLSSPVDSPMSRTKKKEKKRRRKINLLACETCRKLHKKCDGIAPNPCTRCRKKKTTCCYKKRKRRGPKSKKKDQIIVKKPPTMNAPEPSQMVTEETTSQRPQIHLSQMTTHLQNHNHQNETIGHHPTIGESLMEVFPHEYVELPPPKPLLDQSACSLQSAQTVTKPMVYPFYPGQIFFLHPPPPPPSTEIPDSLSSNQVNQANQLNQLNQLNQVNQVQVTGESWIAGWDNF